MKQRKQKTIVEHQQSSSWPQDSAVHPSDEYRTVFKSLLIGSFILVTIVAVLLLISCVVFHNTYVISRILLCIVSLAYFTLAHFLWKRGRLALASRLLIFFYFFISVIVLLGWGLNTSFGLLILAITIILAGILLGARHTLYTAILAIISIFLIQTYITSHHMALFSTTPNPSHFGDAVAYSALLSVLALISWLFGRQTEYLFLKSRRAEQALIKEKESLEDRVRERTQQLQKAQLEEMEQLYQFAEMGQLSTALLHDLANHLSVLNFDIADLKREQHTKTVRRVEESIGYFDRVIDQVRKQLHGKSDQRRFNVATCLKDTIKINASKATDTGVTVTLDSPEKSLTTYGDPLRLSHVAGILIRNAIEAYAGKSDTKKEVLVRLESTQSDLVIRIRDQGSGITAVQRRQIFTPHYSTKKEGLGIGLFIARKITETHFKGTLSLADTTDATEFVLCLPKTHQ